MTRPGPQPTYRVGRTGWLLTLLLASWHAGILPAQESTVPKPPPPTRPLVPLLEPRPFDGKAVENQWNTRRDEPEQQPMAGFVRSLQGNDSRLEVILGQGRLLTLKKPIAGEKGDAVIAIGNPNIADFEVLPNPRMIRITGRLPGVTDLSITTEDEQTFVFEIHVVWDLPLLTAQLRQVYPDADIRLEQLGGHVVIKGQARNVRQSANIEKTLRMMLPAKIESGRSNTGMGMGAGGMGGGGQGGAGIGVPLAPGMVPDLDNAPRGEPGATNPDGTPVDPNAEGEMGRGGGPRAEVRPGGANTLQRTSVDPQIINMMRVPGVQQVMLQVKVGELNRTALREVGADWLLLWGEGNALGSQIGGSTVVGRDLAKPLGLALGQRSTAIGVFNSGQLSVVLRALRDNAVLNVLAEPNLMAMSGQRASFLAGGQFPVPVSQGGVGASSAVSITWKDFGVLLNFVPYVVDDETIRLEVAPEVSSIDYAIGTTLISGGDKVPGVDTRRVDTTVELKQGTTLALAGLLQVELNAQTQRIPGLGDLPYIGPMFSNTSHRKVEKELLVLVTPYLVHPMEADQAPPVPGELIKDPTDCEFYFLNRIEGRTGKDFRATLSWSDPLGLVELLRLEQKYVCGPVGFSEP